MSNRLTQRLMRVTATDGEEYWVYQYEPEDWRLAVRRVMSDRRRKKLPVMAAAGLIKIIVTEADE